MLKILPRTILLAAAALLSAAWGCDLFGTRNLGAPSVLFAQQTPPADKAPPAGTAADGQAAPPAKSEGAGKPEANAKPTPDDEAPVDPAVDARGRKVLGETREAVNGYRSFQTRLVESVAIGTRRFRATGTYVQGEKLKLRLEFQAEVEGFSGSVKEVCDGQVLWTQHAIGDDKTVTRRDVKQILAAVKSDDASPETRSVLVAELGLGGLPALLASIEESMTFTSVADETLEGVPLTVVAGRWKPDLLKELPLDSQNRRQYPPHIPESVRIFVNREGGNLFPRRIVYFKRLPGKDYPTPMLVLDFTEVVLNAPVDESKFRFEPEGIVPEDITKPYIQRLQQLAKEQAAKKPAGEPKPTGETKPPGEAKPNSEPKPIEAGKSAGDAPAPAATKP